MSEPAWAPHLDLGRGDEWWSASTTAGLPGVWADRWRHEPGQRVLFDTADPDGRWLTAADIDQRSRNRAAQLHVAGLESGERLVLCGASSADLVITHIAALRLGAVVVPTNTAYTDHELRHLFTDAEPVLIAIDEPRQELFQGVAAAIDRSMKVIDVAASPLAHATTTPELSLDAAAADDLAMLCYTSGTTGSPKGVRLTHGNLLAGARAVVEAWRWGSGDRLVLALPLFHMHGLGVGVHGTLTAGGSMVVLDRFSVDGVLDAIGHHQATMFFGVPTMYRRLADSDQVDQLGRLRLCVSGSAPLDAALHHRLHAQAGVTVLERYGMTETLMNLSNPFEGERRAGSVGLPLPGVEVALAPAENGQANQGDADAAPTAPAVDRGEILVRGPNVFAGYWRNEVATARAFERGWFRTGDIAERDPDGYYRIVGRSKELIITGGYNVSPREIDEVLEACPGVAEAAAAGIPDADLGEAVAAWIVLESADATTQAAVDAIAAHAQDALAHYKRPRHIYLVESLPRNALGKIQRHLLNPP